MPTAKVACLVVFFIAVSAPAKDKEMDNGTASVQSDRLEVEHQQKRARFEGNVRVVFLGLTLFSDKMEVMYDDNGEIVSLLAQGNVTVVRDNARATSNSARLDAVRNLLILDGNPVLVQGAHRLEGKRITVNLSSGRLDVTQAKGTFKFTIKGQR